MKKFTFLLLLLMGAAVFFQCKKDADTEAKPSLIVKDKLLPHQVTGQNISDYAVVDAKDGKIILFRVKNADDFKYVLHLIPADETQRAKLEQLADRLNGEPFSFEYALDHLILYTGHESFLLVPDNRDGRAYMQNPRSDFADTILLLQSGFMKNFKVPKAEVEKDGWADMKVNDIIRRWARQKDHS
ncbi:MAG: hypothetical protein GXO27_04870 [Chlorobi bacterium]|nr:hypothetical protein [Chlorobiota bacterium]